MIATVPSSNRAVIQAYASDSSPANSATKPGSTHRNTATPKTIRVLRPPLHIGPSSARCWWTYSSAPEIRRTSGLLSRIRITQSAANISRQIGSAVITQEKKLIVVPVSDSMKSMPIRLGGVPIGVISPPTPAP